MGNQSLSSRLLAFTRLSAWKLEPESSTFAPSSAWSNKDMDPVPPHMRTWTTLSYTTYWISCATGVTVFPLASSMVAIGLSWQGALLAIALGHLILAIMVVLIGTVGAQLRVPFPVLTRSSFGFWLSYFSVISLIILSMFWFGIQTFIGSECVYQMLKAIFPSVAHFPNHLPQNARITTIELICYFVYWLIQFPFMFISPRKLQWLFLAKSIIVPPTWLALLIWALLKQSPNGGFLYQNTVSSGGGLSWAWLSAFNSALGFFATAGVNMPDVTRYAKNERTLYVQLIIIPIAFTLTSFIGIAMTSAGVSLYDQVLWDPLKLIDKWDNRPCAFLVSFVFALTTLGTNVSANSLNAGNDMIALYPRYINIRRGQVICAFLGGWALCPWEILATAPGFLSFITGYTIFIAPITGIMITDYWLVHRTRVDVPSMYRPHGRYWYTHGVAKLARRCRIDNLLLPTFPGLIQSLKASSNVHVSAVTRLYVFHTCWGQVPSSFAILDACLHQHVQFVLASTVYFTLSKLFRSDETVVKNAIIELETQLGFDSRFSSNGQDGKVDVMVVGIV
ncbi:NCS1 nucleoside transporter family [Multifurca ochricompacta]|uniref:NCS1 nucleoside transporter family n=1 Tax=Multifurca ochricompacta TaxID=376703 RepID=A0AAD4QLK3_9AGAM|nr:NCS1 nucleoside transporter family [Multifurca ochricompacta]